LEEYSGCGDDERSSWTRLSDGVAPINVTCNSSSLDGHKSSASTTVFRVAAYSRHVEKILDVIISQPGSCWSCCLGGPRSHYIYVYSPTAFAFITPPRRSYVIDAVCLSFCLSFCL